MPEPKIHAVEMVRRIREKHHAQIKELTPQEKIAFFRKKAGALTRVPAMQERPLMTCEEV